MSDCVRTTVHSGMHEPGVSYPNNVSLIFVGQIIHVFTKTISYP